MIDTWAYLLITTRYGTKKKVISKLTGLDVIHSAHELYGQYDIITHLRLPSLKELEDFIQANIRVIPEIESTQTLIVSDIPCLNTDS